MQKCTAFLGAGQNPRFISMQDLERLCAALELAKQDADKFYGKGNKASGTRLRAAMQEIKTLAQNVRNDVTEVKNRKV